MNVFGFIDYKRPVEPSNDNRTSSYLGHVYMNDVPHSNIARRSTILQLRNEPKNGEVIPLVTEHMDQYTGKNPDYCSLRNPSLKQIYTHYMKGFEEVRFRNVPKLLQQQTSTYKSDFRHELPRPVDSIEFHIPSAAKNTPNTEVNSKSTSQRLDYPPYDSKHLGRGSKDCITFWSWIKDGHGKCNVRAYKEDMCEHRNRCIPRKNEFPPDIKHVPHSGLITESRSNYKNPLQSSREEISIDLKQTFNCAPIQFEYYTESKMYGSGERLDKYINIQATRPNVLAK